VGFVGLVHVGRLVLVCCCVDVEWVVVFVGCSGFLDGVKEAFDGLKLLGVLVGRLFVVAVVFRWPESAFEGLVGWTKI
jgi:hypothetical protein